MNKRKKIEFIVMLVIGIFGFGWMIIDSVKIFLMVVNEKGVPALLFDGGVQHKIGELMIWIPFFSILLMSKVWEKERVFGLSSKLRIVMVIGGLLNGLAWYVLSDELPWTDINRIWFVVLLIFAMFATPVASWMVRTEAKYNLRFSEKNRENIRRNFKA